MKTLPTKGGIQTAGLRALVEQLRRAFHLAHVAADQVRLDFIVGVSCNSRVVSN